jgi:hypothetical protein
MEVLVLKAYWQHSGKQYGDSSCTFYDDISYTAQIVTANKDTAYEVFSCLSLVF